MSCRTMVRHIFAYSSSTGNLPTDTAYFEQMSQAGTNGTDVGTTITTQGDILYRDGSGLQRLAAGILVKHYLLVALVLIHLGEQ